MRAAKILLVLVFIAASTWAAEPGSGPEPPKKPPAEPGKPPAEPPKKPGLFEKKDDKEKPEEIIVTGSRVPTEKKHAGASVSVVTGQELELHRPAAAWDALQFTPGVSFVQGGTRGQLTSLFMRGGESDHTLVLLDGFKLNDDGGGFPWETLPATGFGRVEILRGPGSALYGAEAMTGVVQVLTERGSGPPRLGLSSEAGSYGTFRETSQFVGEDGPFAYNLNLSRFDMTDGRFKNSDVHATAFAARLDWEQPGGVHLELVQHVTGDEVGDYKSDAIEDPNARVEHRRELTGLIFSGKIADLVDSKLLLGRTLTSYVFDDRIDSLDTSDYRTTKDLERLSTEWQNSVKLYELGPAVGKLSGGVAWEEELGRAEAQASGAYISENHIDRTRWARAVYAEKRLELWEALTIDAGARTEEHSTFGTETSARVAAALWVEPSGTRLHSSWGQGIKSPTFFENFDNSYYQIGGFTTYTVGNPRLRPEQVTSADAGIEQHLLADAVVAGITVFQNRFEDYINFKFDFPTSTYENAGRAEAEGIEYELALKPVKWARARGTLTITHTRAFTDDSALNFEDGKALIRRPEQVASAVLEVEPLALSAAMPDWAKRLTVFGEMVHQAESVDVDWDAYKRVELPDFTEYNAGFNWEIFKAKGHSLKLFGRWENVTDTRIEQVVGVTGTRSSFLGGVSYTVVF